MRSGLVCVFVFLAISPDAVVPREVTGKVGGSLDILCEYDEGYESNSKFWCRGADRSCTVVQTSSSGQEATNGRVSIKDNRSARIFTVTMAQLREDDGGRYQCGIDIYGWDYLFSPTLVHISEPTKPPQTALTTTSATSTSKGATTIQRLVTSARFENISEKDQKMSQRPSFTAWNAVQVAQIGLLLFCMTVVCIVFRGQTD